MSILQTRNILLFEFINWLFVKGHGKSKKIAKSIAVAQMATILYFNELVL